MHVEELKNEGLRREYKVTIEGDEMTRRVDKILRDFGRTAPMKGFRPGKAPLSLLKQLHGKAARGQAIQEVISETSEKLFADKEVRPATRPDVDLPNEEEQTQIGDEVVYTLGVEVLPDISVDDFKAPKMEKLVAEVTDAEVDARLGELAKNQRGFEDAPEDHAAADGDRVVCDFVGRIDGEAFEGGTAEDAQVELGSDTFIPGFEEQLVGVKAGDEKTVTVTFPEDYRAEDLAGKEAAFEVKVKGIKRPGEAVTPDDEFAKNFGMEDLEQLRTAIRDQIGSENEQMSRAKLKRELLDHLAETYDFPVPDSMVDMEFQQIWGQVRQDMLRSGEKSIEELQALSEPEDADEKAEFQRLAERRVRLGLLLSELGVANNIQITREEVNSKIIEEVRKYPGQEREVLEFYQQNEDAQAQLRAPIFEDKVVDYVLEIAEVDEKSVSRDELEEALRKLQEEDADAPAAA
ncbi:trigger factor [Rhodothalassium salexigens DSM 2132]|uniref:Trigger factor n=1 Tax=Rhodothalassium salexigens DSM 2132 TaxID=1188247 RepID=A0A4R2PRA4_RHOSA|nr:trigger factor [Rhodothalassium salexigens]MBB4210229.1 trigger factor [Rhodothalassium salexigens DSM 2132]MBK1638670.1 trigger factor [Rhodothalassium salexigens DSM 2132]TCP38393.1 trigger factor [Rhodothalassium salexigens DSM 2132]